MTEKKNRQTREQPELVGFGWFSKTGKAINIGLTDKDGNIDNDMRMVVFTAEFEAVKAGTAKKRDGTQAKSFKIYKSRDPNFQNTDDT